MDYALHIFTIASLYAILAVSLDLVAGHTGCVSMAHAAFCGLGAYTSALLAIRYDASFAVAIALGMAVAGVASLAVSLPSLRLHDDYFVIATFAFQVILVGVFNNWIEVTGGPLGISAIPRPSVFGWRIQHSWEFLVLAVGLAGLAYAIVWRLTTGPLGRVLHAIREDEILAEALGKPTLRIKVTMFAASAGMAALAGGLYAHYVTYIDPTNFTVMESILVISMVIIGGAGSIWGPLIGAIVLVTLPEGLRLMGFPSSTAANLRQIAYGSLLVATMVIRPKGLVGRYAFGR